MIIRRCNGEGQGSCKRCNDNGIWNRHWMTGLFHIDGTDNCYCYDCCKKIAGEDDIEIK